MKVFILPEFLQDLKSLDNIGTLARVLDKLFDHKFEFIQHSRDDHRYNGVDNAWIRVVSRGNTAYRSIYILNDKGVYLYRAGTKKIEDNLSTPDLKQIFIELTEFKIQIANYVNTFQDSGKLLRSPEPLELYKEIIKFNHVNLSEIWMISPRITKELFYDNSTVGRFINKATENGTAVTLITKPPENLSETTFFDDLETRNIIVLYHDNIHANAWYFNVDSTALSLYETEEGYTTTAILGSANLTFESLGVASNSLDNNVELCYKLPFDKNTEFYEYCNLIFNNSTEHAKHKQKLRQ